ncbi:PLP-dependent transferase [Pyrenochaeta sp. DS3sAY3a]|nr:PLP-dependent transferase [Pyrenochaeta sp. DS3sAY3a]
MGQIAESILITDDHFQGVPDLSKYRSFVPVVANPKITYLNASFQPPMNIRVKAALDQYLDEALNHPHPKPEWQKNTIEARRLLAEYLNVTAESLAFTRDTTEGLNLFQRSLKWEPGANIVVLDTEHPNQVYGWLALVGQGLEVRRVPAGHLSFADASTFAPQVDERTIAIGFSSIMFHNGQLNNIEDICTTFRPKGVHVLVDMTQHVGVAPIDLRAWNVSAAAFGCHKGLGCPTGLGALYINPEVLTELKPTPPIVGAGAIANLPGTLLADPEVQYHATSQRYEHLNVNLMGTAALKASLKLLLHDIGISRVEQHLRTLGHWLTLQCEKAGVGIAGSAVSSQRAPHVYVLRLLDARWKDHFDSDNVYVSQYRDGVRSARDSFTSVFDIRRLSMILTSCSTWMLHGALRASDVTRAKVQPCSNCKQGRHICEFRANDGRKRPISHTYLSALESRLAYFESLTQSLKKASNEERDEILAGVSLEDHLESKTDVEDVPDHNSSAASENPGTPQTVSLRSGPQGTLQFHGPTSMYLDADAIEQPAEEPSPTFLPRGSNASPYFPVDASGILRLASALGVDNKLILETLPLFFLHQYPMYMFIYREAFLSDYYDNAYRGQYWSYPLLYSMCALGAPHSDRAETRSKNHLLAKCAQEVILCHCLTKPSPTTIQALLCLAFHEVGQGNASQGWLFSGMAFRMGQDLGFHQDPTRWVLQDRSIASAEDIEIRRRIYWGSYVADKFMSLYLGRPVHLREDDAAVEASTPLPDFPSDHTWFGLSEIASKHARFDLPKPQLTAALKHMVFLGKIFQDMMVDIFSSTRNKHRTESYRLNRLGDLNLQLSKWQTALPEGLQWSQWSPNKTIHSHVLVLHLYYHAMLLSLNRHFVQPSTGFPHAPSSRETCGSSSSTITILIRQFRTHHGLNTAPLMLVYALVMVIITQIQTLNQGRETIGFLLRSLEECSHCYKLAGEARSRLGPSLGLSKSGNASASASGSTRRPVPASATQGQDEDVIATGDTQSEDLGNQMVDPTFLDPAMQSDFLQGNDLMGDTLNLDAFDLPGFGDVNEGFHSWFSIGHMG